MWQGLVWGSDPARSQLVGLDPAGDTFQTIALTNGSLPRYLAIGPNQSLWFTESSYPTQIGRIDPTTRGVQYFSIPTDADAISASLLFENSSLAYAVTVNLSSDYGQVYSFDPSLADPSFRLVSVNETLLGPYSAAVALGGLWVGEHHASNLAFYDSADQDWTFYPTSVVPGIPLTLPYYLAVNGSALWFNEHDANKVAVLCCDRSSLTEYNVSDVSALKTGIGNMLTIGVDANLVWYTEWTADEVGYVNASYAVPFSISSLSNGTETTISQGSSAQFQLNVSGASPVPLKVLFADSEAPDSIPRNITFSSNQSSVTLPPSGDGSRTLSVTVYVGRQTPPGSYLLLVTVSDSLISRSVYLPVEVTSATG